jgi:hypothetical protein
MALTIEPVRTRSQLADFITLPRRLYSGMPGYVAPLDMDRYHLLDPRKCSFFSHGSAQYWIAFHNGRAVGRISAQIDLLVGPATPLDLGLFGCIDAIDDGEVVAALFRSAEGWLNAHDRKYIRGPFLLSINGEPGLLVEGQHEPPFTLLGWHPAYLDRQIQNLGYVSAMRLRSYSYDIGDELNYKYFSDLKRRGSAAGFSIRDVRLSDLESEAESARCFFNDAWQKNWGFVPLAKTDMQAFVKAFRPVLFPGCGFVIEDAGKPAAILLMIPNIFEIAKNLGPDPNLIDMAKLLFRIWRQSYHSFSIVLLGIASKYQRSVRGALLAGLTFSEAAHRLGLLGPASVAASWVLENNRGMIAPIERFGMRCTRIYAIYEKHL